MGCFMLVQSVMVISVNRIEVSALSGCVKMKRSLDSYTDNCLHFQFYSQYIHFATTDRLHPGGFLQVRQV